jgi:homoserine dehydrogenase
MKQDGQYGIAIVGCGTVGGAAAALLEEDREALSKKTGQPIRLKYIVDVDFTYAESLGLSSELFEKEFDRVLDDDEVKVVAELVGGTTIAREIVERCLEAEKHVVTANKALLAQHGPELFALARKNGVTLAFEASCGGGIPIVRALYDGLTANRIDALYGIVNGTCNFILTEMIQKGVSYSEALSDAQRTGLAEADPTLDVSGMDSAHKLTILASLAFQKRVSLEDIPVEGIDSLELSDVVFGRELGYIVKLLAVAQRTEGGLSLRVRPAFIGTDHPLAWISGPFNAVSVYGHAVGHTMYYGRGAGGRPTASAVVADILSVALGSVPAAFKSLTIWPDQTEETSLLPTDDIESRYYLRLMVRDEPGVFARIAEILGAQRISLSSVLQKEPSAPEGETAIVPVVITTHTAREGNVRTALKALDSLDEVVEQSVCISILDEHEEKF